MGILDELFLRTVLNSCYCLLQTDCCNGAEVVFGNMPFLHSVMWNIKSSREADRVSCMKYTISNSNNDFGHMVYFFWKNDILSVTYWLSKSFNIFMTVMDLKSLMSFYWRITWLEVIVYLHSGIERSSSTNHSCLYKLWVLFVSCSLWIWVEQRLFSGSMHMLKKMSWYLVMDVTF